jgi:hypothetical protein
MSKLTRIIAVLAVGVAAAATVRYAFGSAAWQHVRHFIFGLPWPTLEIAGFLGVVADACLAAFLGGAYTTLLVVWTRISATSSAAVLSVAVFVAGEPGVFHSTLRGELDSLVEGHIKLTVVFFFAGWLIATLAQRIARRLRSNDASNLA